MPWLTLLSDSFLFLTGQFNPETQGDFLILEDPYALQKRIFLEKETALAFQSMVDQAGKDSIRLFAVSGLRTFSEQKVIWDKKICGQHLSGNQHSAWLNKSLKERVTETMRYSAPPGTSRHHWGTEVDIVSVDTDFFTSHEGHRISSWLQQNGNAFGFYEVYPSGRKTGYAPEPWHWSFSKKSKPLLRQFKEEVSMFQIKALLGDCWLPENLLEDFVSGVTDVCL